MTLEDIEGEAGVLYRSTGFELDEPAPMLELARRALGRGCVLQVHARAIPGDACLATVGGERRLYLRRGLSPERARWAIAHELGHWALGVDSSSRENEDNCDALAAALVAPRAAFRAALRECGDRYHKLAVWFQTTESCAALRLGEVTGDPLALIAPARVRVRGSEFVWPGEAELRQLAAKPRVPGVRKARLRDDQRRVAMRVG